MRRCSNCHFSRGYAEYEVDGALARTTWCHESSPQLVSAGVSGWPPVSPDGWCGRHRRRSAIFRAIMALFRRN